MKSRLSPAQWLFMSVAAIVLILVRFIEHPFNFTPMVGLALLGAAYMRKSWMAWLLPIAGFWVSDLILNNVVYSAYFDGFVLASKPFLFTALALGVMVVLGRTLLKKLNGFRLITASLAASVLFFVISNFGVWLIGLNGYEMSTVGLMQCYAAGIPFFKTAILGDLLFTGVLFGTWALLFERERVLATASIKK